MRIIEFIKRLFHREKPIEIKQNKRFEFTKKDETNVCRKINKLFR